MQNYFSSITFLFLGGMILSYALGNGFLWTMDGLSSKILKDDLIDFEDAMVGPERICLITGSVIEEFSFDGGIPELDVYQWKIMGPSDEILLDPGFKANLQSLPFTFSMVGDHNIELQVRRGGAIVFTGSKNVEVIKGATALLKESYILCEGIDLKLSAVDPLTPNLNDYVFEWQDGQGNPIGENTNNISISQIGDYKVRYYFLNSNGNPECENLLTTTISTAFNFELNSSSTFACPGDFVQITPSISNSGIWSYEKNGDGDIVKISDSQNLGINPSIDLDGYGNYIIYFTITNPDVANCLITESISLTFAPVASYDIVAASSTSDCLSNDGSLTIQAYTDLDQLFYVVNDSTNSPVVSLLAGETYTFTNLSAGVYSFEGLLGGCPFKLAGVVDLNDTPPSLDFDIQDVYDESCSDTGKNLGGFTVKFFNGPVDAEYTLVSFNGDIAFKGELFSASELPIEVAGGIYYFEVYDIDGCTLPWKEEIEILGLPQVDLPKIQDFSICESFEFIPISNNDVVFTLTLPDKSQVIKEKGNAFIITMEGDYSLLATHKSDPNICPKQETFFVELVSPIDFEVDFFNQDCVGNQTYKAVLKDKLPEEVIIQWYNENDEVIGTGMELFPTSYGTFKLDIQPANSFACPIPAKEFEVKVPVLEIEINLEASPLCPFGPGALIELIIQSDIDEVDRIEWVYFDEDDNRNELASELNNSFISATNGGIYEVSVWNRFKCELGRTLIKIEESTDLVAFEIDPQYTVCESYHWIPDSNGPMNFVLTYPNGEVVSKNSTEYFNLNLEGIYTIRGENPDSENTPCPNEKSFEVILVSAISFEPGISQKTCAGEFTFEANISGDDPDQAIFMWTNEIGQIVGNEQFFITSIPGSYALEVQPKGSLPCDVFPVPFIIEDPILTLDVVMIVGTLCPDSDAAILTLETETDGSDRIEWWYIDFNGNRSQLLQFLNVREIPASDEGTYEVLVYNDIDCPLGKDVALVMRSMDKNRPIVNESYLICGQYGVGENINPGLFSTYNWFLDDNLVSKSPIFKPQIPGEYFLVVNSVESCEYTTTFTVLEDCELRISLPSAIRPSDPNREFLVYTNHLVDELEVWIFNKWGANIFHCANVSLISEASTCIWDGTVNGKKVPIGSYAAKIFYKNNGQNITKTIVENILVID